MKRYYVENLLGDNIKLDGEVFRHLIVVMRQKIGDELILFNAKDKIKVRLLSIDKRSVLVEKICDMPKSLPSPCNIHLAQVVLTGEKMDFCIQKATELGVAEITPLVSENFSKKIDIKRQAKKLEHWQKIIISACEQSENDNIPILNAMENLSDWIATHDFSNQIFLDFNGINWREYVGNHQTLAQVGLVVGAAGGISATEQKYLIEKNWQGINLGKRILRGETASLAMLTLLQNQWGDLSL